METENKKHNIKFGDLLAFSGLIGMWVMLLTTASYVFLGASYFPIGNFIVGFLTGLFFYLAAKTKERI